MLIIKSNKVKRLVIYTVSNQERKEETPEKDTIKKVAPGNNIDDIETIKQKLLEDETIINKKSISKKLTLKRHYC